MATGKRLLALLLCLILCISMLPSSSLAEEQEQLEIIPEQETEEQTRDEANAEQNGDPAALEESGEEMPAEPPVEEQQEEPEEEPQEQPEETMQAEQPADSMTESQEASWEEPEEPAADSDTIDLTAPEETAEPEMSEESAESEPQNEVSAENGESFAETESIQESESDQPSDDSVQTESDAVASDEESTDGSEEGLTAETEPAQDETAQPAEGTEQTTEAEGDAEPVPEETKPADETIETEEEKEKKEKENQEEETVEKEVRVLFQTDPADAVVTVYTQEEMKRAEVVSAEKDGSYLLVPGSYLYTAEAERFEPLEETVLIVETSEETLKVPVALKPDLSFLTQEWHSIPIEFIEEPADDTVALEGFAAEALYGDVVPDGMGPALAKKNFGGSLKGNEARLYKTLKSLFSQVANGNRSSTVFSIPLSKIVGKRQMTQTEYNKAATFSYDFSRVVGMLVADSPYEQYWFDKYDQNVYAYSEGNAFWSGNLIDISKINFVYVFPVTAECANGSQMKGIYCGVKTSIGTTVRTAVANAKSIVSRASGYSDMDKLRYYAEQICAMTSYNYDAVDNPYQPYGNPWQMVWIFDGNSSTKVVCEGYSRGFQYLCDLTNFNRDIACYCLLGHWYGPYNDGGHMWNAVTLDNGENYIVDITHSDDNNTGLFNDAVFLRTADSGNPSSGYYVTRKDGVQVFYGYSSEYGSFMYTTEAARRITVSKVYLSIPVLSTVANTDSGVQITWNAVSGAAKYRVMRKTGNGSWSRIGETAGTSYIDKTAKVRTKYSYSVVAVNGSDTSGYDKKGLTITRLYAAPTINEAANVSKGIRIAWSTGKGASKYLICRKAPGEKNWKKLGTTASKTYTDKRVSPGKTYTYMIRSLDSNGNYVSANSSTKSVTYLAAPKLKGLGNVNGGVKIRWSKARGATKYQILRKASGESGWSRIGETTTLTWTDTTAKSGIKYGYAVCAVSGDSIGTRSSAKAIKYIAAPVLLSVYSTPGGVQVTWQKSDGAAKYRLFRKTGTGNWATLKDTTALSYTDKAVKKGTKYSYTVRCLSRDGKSYASGYDTIGRAVVYTPVAAPKITGHPKAVTVMAGTKTTFTVAASGSSLKYQWQYRAGSNGVWNNSGDSGSNTATVTVTVASGMNGRQYRCAVSNPGGTVYSDAALLTVYSESGWVLPNQVPANATIIQTSYSYRESTESAAASMNGWVSNGSTWRETGSGSAYYASFPSGYDTNDRYYNGYMHEPYSAFETENSKREVSNYRDGYIYWHWMYNVRYASGTTRAISSQKGTYGSGRFWYGYFYAMASTTDCPYLSNGYCCSQNVPSYNAKSVVNSFASSSDKSSSTSGLGTDRFFRFERNVSIYRDYTRYYRYYRDLQYQATDPGNGPNISNKVVYVKYRING